MVVVRLIARGVTTQGKDVADSRRRIALQYGLNLGFRVSHTSEMRDRIQRGLFFEPEDEIVGEFTCRAACSIGHANKRRLDGLQLQDGGKEILLRLGCFRREKLK